MGLAHTHASCAHPLTPSLRTPDLQAEVLYKRAIDADPLHAYSLYNYALLLEDVRGDYDGAETHFRLALKADPKDSVVLADYAQFLKTRRKVQCVLRGAVQACYSMHM